VAAAREIKHLLKPGGKLVIMDIDDRLHLFDPEDPPEVQAISNRFIEEHKQKGGDRNIGRKLLRILRDAGFVDVSLDLIGVHSDEYGMDTMAPIAGDDVYRALLEEGKITQEELELMVAADKRAHEPDAISMYVIFTACGTKLE
jgi:SAM-dependent methyltransferase